MRRVRGLAGDAELSAPVGLPEPGAAWGGYRLGQHLDGAASTKLLVNLVARATGGLLALEVGHEPGSKAESVRRFAAEDGGTMGAFAAGFYQALNCRWGYRVPAEETARHDLEGWIRQLPEFEDGFLARAGERR